MVKEKFEGVNGRAKVAVGPLMLQFWVSWMTAAGVVGVTGRCTLQSRCPSPRRVAIEYCSKCSSRSSAARVQCGAGGLVQCGLGRAEGGRKQVRSRKHSREKAGEKQEALAVLG